MVDQAGSIRPSKSGGRADRSSTPGKLHSAARHGTSEAGRGHTTALRPQPMFPFNRLAGARSAPRQQQSPGFASVLEFFAGADDSQHQPPRVMDEPPRRQEQLKPQALGPGRQPLRLQADPFQRGHRIVPHHRQAQPSRAGPEPPAGHPPAARSFFSTASKASIEPAFSRRHSSSR